MGGRPVDPGPPALLLGWTHEIVPRMAAMAETALIPTAAAIVGGEEDAGVAAASPLSSEESAAAKVKRAQRSEILGH